MQRKVIAILLIIVLTISLFMNISQFSRIKNLNKEIALNNMNLLIEMDDYLFSVKKYLVKSNYREEDLSFIIETTQSFNNLLITHNIYDISEQLNNLVFICEKYLEQNQFPPQDFNEELKSAIDNIKESYTLSGNYEEYLKYYYNKFN